MSSLTSELNCLIAIQTFRTLFASLQGRTEQPTKMANTVSGISTSDDNMIMEDGLDAKSLFGAGDGLTYE